MSHTKKTDLNYHNHYRKGESLDNREYREVANFNNRKNFKISIAKMKEYLDASEGVHSITDLCEKFNFQKRRFADVVIVLDTIGVITKMDSDTLYWHGVKSDKIRRNIKQICYDPRLGIFEDHVTLKTMFPTPNPKKDDHESLIVGISQVTQYFISLYVGMGEKTLDVRDMSFILSYDDLNRQKPMLCKLYLVGNILEAVGIMVRPTGMQGVYTFKDEYFVNINYELEFPLCCDSQQEPLSILSLLNKVPNDLLPSFVLNRRKEYRDMLLYLVSIKEV